MSLVLKFKTFFQYFVHPFYAHRMMQLDPSSDQNLKFYESVCFSWVFKIIEGIGRIFLMFIIAFSITQFLEESDPIFQSFMDEGRFNGFYLLVITTIFEVLFFPLMVMLFVKIWEYVLKFYGFLLKEKWTQERVQSIFSITLASNIYLIIPVFGKSVQSVASMFYFYGGLRNQLGMTRSLSLCVLFTPALLLLAFLCLTMLLAVLFS